MEEARSSRRAGTGVEVDIRIRTCAAAEIDRLSSEYYEESLRWIWRKSLKWCQEIKVDKIMPIAKRKMENFLF